MYCVLERMEGEIRMSFAGNNCPECNEPLCSPYPLLNILGTYDSVRNCTDYKKCDYWECMPDHNTMADYGLNQDGTPLTEKERRENRKLASKNVWPEVELQAEVKKLREVLKSITDDIIPPQHGGQTQVELTYKLIEPFMKELIE